MIFEKLINEAIKHRSKDLKIPEGQHTIGEFIRAVFAVKTEAEAAEFYADYIKHLDNLPPEPGDNPRKLTSGQLARSNIGWCFGEGMSPEKIAMWSKVGASHPVFGNILPSPALAFKMGLKAGKEAKK